MLRGNMAGHNSIIFMNKELKSKKLTSLLQNIRLNWMFDVLNFKTNFCSNLSLAMLLLNFIIRRIHQLEQKLHCKYCTQIFSKFCLKQKFLQTQFKFFAQGNLTFLVETFCKKILKKETLLNFARKRCKGKRCANLVRFSRQKT